MHRLVVLNFSEQLVVTVVFLSECVSYHVIGSGKKFDSRLYKWKESFHVSIAILTLFENKNSVAQVLLLQGRLCLWR